MTKRNKWLIAGSMVLCLASAANAAEIATNAALMQAMDKVTGRVNKITVPVNSKITFGDFSLVLRACKKRPAEETPENFAFVDVADKSFGTDEYNIFRGWLLSSTPGINAIEHPIYDVWLLECIDAEIDGTKLLTPEELAARDNLPGKDVLLGKAKPEIKEQEEELDKPQENIIHIKDFTTEDRDIEKDIKEMPRYISESSTSYVSDIEEGDEPQNLLQFMKIQEAGAGQGEKKNAPKAEDGTQNGGITDDGWNAAIDAEMEKLQQDN